MYQPPQLTCINNDINEVHGFGKGVPQVDVVESHDSSFTLCPLQSLLAFHSLLTPHLVLVELGKIIDYDWDGQSNDQNTANSARRADKLSQEGLGSVITISNGRPARRRASIKCNTMKRRWDAMRTTEKRMQSVSVTGSVTW